MFTVSELLKYLEGLPGDAIIGVENDKETLVPFNINGCSITENFHVLKG